MKKEAAEQAIGELDYVLRDLAFRFVPIGEPDKALKAAKVYFRRGHYRAAFLRARAGSEIARKLLND